MVEKVGVMLLHENATSLKDLSKLDGIRKPQSNSIKIMECLGKRAADCVQGIQSLARLLNKSGIIEQESRLASENNVHMNQSTQAANIETYSVRSIRIRNESKIIHSTKYIHKIRLLLLLHVADTLPTII